MARDTFKAKGAPPAFLIQSEDERNALLAGLAILQNMIEAQGGLDAFKRNNQAYAAIHGGSGSSQGLDVDDIEDLFDRL